MSLKKFLFTALATGLMFSATAHAAAEKRPVWKEVSDNKNLIEVEEEAGTWVRYKKSSTKCPVHARAGHQHKHEHSHLSHTQHRRAHYQFDDRNQRVKGVLNVKEGDESWVWKRQMTPAELNEIIV